MVAITKRMRLWRGVPKDELDLAKFRAQTREALNKPYHFEAKSQPEPWTEKSSDPLDSPFKPFSKLGSGVFAPLIPASVLKRELTGFNRGRVLLPLGVAMLLITGFVLWQTLGAFNSFRGIISPTPRVVEVKNNPTPTANTEPANSQVVPTGTELQPGGPYTGTGGSEPITVPTAATNQAAPVGSSPTNLTPTTAVAPVSCPSGMICQGTAVDGTPCSNSNPCKIVYSGGLATTTSQLLTQGSTISGQPCSLTSPCVLTH